MTALLNRDLDGFVPPHETSFLIDSNFAWEATGEADIVLDDLADALGDTPQLYDDLQEKVARFTSGVASSLLFLKLETTDRRPDELDTYNPNEIHIYLGTGEVRTNQTIRTVRFTNAGTRSSTSSMDDVEAFIAALPKGERWLALSLGSYRVDDLTALDVDFEMLIDTLAAMGVDDAVIEEMGALLVSGDAPPALLEAVQAILELGAVTDPAAIPALLEKIEASLADALPEAKSDTVLAVLERIQEGLQPLAASPPAALMPKIQAFQRGEAPKLSERLSALKIITNVIQTTAALIRDPDLPKAEREKLQATLAGLRANIFNPASPVFQQAFMRLVTQIMPLAEKFPAAVTALPGQDAATTMEKPVSMIALRVADAVQAIAKATILLLPPAARQALGLPVGLGNKPSALLDAKVSPLVMQTVLSAVAKPALNVVSGRMVPSMPLRAPQAVLRGIERAEMRGQFLATPARQSGIAALARNDNKIGPVTARPALSLLRAAGRSVGMAMGAALTRVMPSRAATVDAAKTPVTIKRVEASPPRSVEKNAPARREVAPASPSSRVERQSVSPRVTGVAAPAAIASVASAAEPARMETRRAATVSAPVNDAPSATVSPTPTPEVFTATSSVTASDPVAAASVSSSPSPSPVNAQTPFERPASDHAAAPTSPTTMRDPVPDTRASDGTTRSSPSSPPSFTTTTVSPVTPGVTGAAAAPVAGEGAKAGPPPSSPPAPSAADSVSPSPSSAMRGGAAAPPTPPSGEATPSAAPKESAPPPSPSSPEDTSSRAPDAKPDARGDEIPECCRQPFNKAVPLPPGVSVTPDGNLVVAQPDGTTKTYTQEAVQQDIDDHKVVLTQLHQVMADRRASDLNTLADNLRKQMGQDTGHGPGKCFKDCCNPKPEKKETTAEKRARLLRERADKDAKASHNHHQPRRS